MNNDLLKVLEPKLVLVISKYFSSFRKPKLVTRRSVKIVSVFSLIARIGLPPPGWNSFMYFVPPLSIKRQAVPLEGFDAVFAYGF